MKHGSLFSGIGGFDLAAEWMGWENVFHCEWMEFPKKILKYYWPNAISYHDITKTDFTIHRGTIDILTGGFPCQPYSMAGKRKGKNDERHLWPHMHRAIQEIEPTYIVGENVYGIINWNGGLVFEEVCVDLENCGYQVQPVLLPCSAINAPHKRERIFFIAYNKNGNVNNTKCIRWDKINNENGIVEKSPEKKCRKFKFSGTNCTQNKWWEFPFESPVCGGNDGVSYELDGITFSKWRNESIRGYGNAVVPPLIYEIFKVIQQMEDLNNGGKI